MIDVDELNRSVGGMILRGIVKAVDEANGLRRLWMQLRKGEDTEALEQIEPLGFTAYPLEGAEGVVVTVGNNSDHQVSISVADSRYRPQGLQAGDSCHYDCHNHTITLGANGITIDSDTQSVTINSGSAIVNANVKATVAAPIVEVNGTVTTLGCAFGDPLALPVMVMNLGTPAPSGSVFAKM